MVMGELILKSLIGVYLLLAIVFAFEKSLGNFLYALGAFIINLGVLLR